MSDYRLRGLWAAVVYLSMFLFIFGALCNCICVLTGERIYGVWGMASGFAGITAGLAAGLKWFLDWVDR